MSILNVDKIQPIGGGSTITVDATDIQASTGTIRASTFSGDVSATGIGVTSLNVTGVSTFAGNIDANGDLDVDGHTNLDNVSVAGVTTFSGVVKIPTVAGTNTNAALNVLFQTASGVIDGGSQLTYNPGGDVLSINGNHISANTFRGDGNTGTLTCDNHSSTTFVTVSNTVDIGTVDNTTGAFTVKEGSNEYITIDTTNSSELIKFGTAGSERLRIDSSGHILPGAAGTQDLGSTSKEWGDLYFANSKGLKLGSSQVGDLFNDGTDMYIRNSVSNGQILIRSGGNIHISNYAANEMRASFNNNASVQLYYDSVNTFETTASGIKVKGPEGGTGIIELNADEGDDNNDQWRFVSEAGSSQLNIQNYSAGSWYNSIRANGGNGSAELFHNNISRLQTTNVGVNISGAGGNALVLTGSMSSSEQFKISNTASGGHIQIGMQQQDTDGLHHRAYIKASKGSASIAGKLELLARGSGGGTNRGWIIDAAVGIQANQQVLPETNNTYDLGSSTKRWQNVYTTDLQLSNEGKTNDIDNTWGNYTIQEGESDLFLINNRSGKKYKFNLTEVS